ncbi:MAG: hypothetical protein ACFBSC_15190 [Microcoleaceae cyanobacterium]
MNAALRYWNWVRLNWMGQRQVEEVQQCRTFFRQQFSHLINKNQVQDPEAQRQLVGLMRPESQVNPSGEISQSAEYCLRCFISHEIDAVCYRLAKRFGEMGGFAKTDLLAFVLDDFRLSSLQNSQTEPRSDYLSLADKILQSFDPARSQLSTWTSRLVKSHTELTRFLWECGVHLGSDWAVLNNCHPKKLHRLLTATHNWALAKADRAAQVLDSYQTVYRGDRLDDNRSSSRSVCKPPSAEQLARILTDLNRKGIVGYRDDDLLEDLTAFAELIRRSRQPKQEPLQDDNHAQTGPDEVESEMQDFLYRYRQLLATQLDQALQQVLAERIKKLQKSRPPKDQAFLLALDLFCQGQPMKDIAQQVGLQKQYQVSRLLQLKSLRTDVQQRLLAGLRNDVAELASRYATNLEIETLEVALAAEIDQIMQDAKRENNSSNCSRSNLFTNYLYRHVSSLKSSPTVSP